MALPSAAHGQVLYNGTRSTVVSGPMYIWPEGNTFLFPSGLVVDHNGYLWANDLGSNQILKFAPNGGGFSIILSSNGFPTSFSSEQDVARECGDFANQIAVDAGNHLYYPTTSDSGNRGRCYSGAQENGAWFSGTDPLNVWGLALDSVGNAYLADPVTAAIWIYPVPVGQIVDNGPVYCVPTVNSDGTPVTDCHASPGVNDFQAISNISPVSVAVDRYGNIFYTTFTELWEGIYQGNGNYNNVKIAGGFNSVRALAVGRDEIVYVADAGNNRIVREVPTAGGWSQSPFNGFNRPSGVTLDDAGNLYVSDTDNFQIVKYNISAPSFGLQNVGTTSGSMGLSFTLLPGTTLGSVAIVTNGATGQDFADAGSSTCTAQTYSSITNCTVNVKFTPMAAGSRGGAIVFYDASGNVLQTLRLSGQGVGPAPVFEASSIQLLTPQASYYNEWGATATDGAGNLYIPEPSADAVMVIAPGGVTSTLGLTSPAINPNDVTASSTLNNPSAVAVDSVGSLLIADTGNNRIVVRQPTGTAGGYYLNNLRTPGFTLNGPQAVATDVSGNIFIADTGNNRIVEVLPGGAAKQFGPTVNQPSSLAVDSNGNVYFTLTSQGKIYRIPSSGGTATELNASPESLIQATGIAVDAAGTVYVADQKFGAVEIPASGTPHAINLPWPLGGYTGPNAISLDPTGNLYFSASGLGVYKMARTGVSLGFATTKTGATSTDSPQTVLVENAGNQPLNISKVSFPTDFPQGSGDSAACTGSTTLASGATCDLPIQFAPATGSTLSELVTLTDNAGNVGGATQSVSVNGTGVVGGQSQTIQPVLTGGTYTKTPSYPYSAFGPLVYIQATSGLPVTLTVVSGPGNFGGAVSSSTQHVLSFTAAGLVTIQATQPGNSTYAPATPVTFTVTSTPATISLNTRHSSFTQVYGAATPTVTFLLSGLVYSTDQVYLTITGGATPSSPVGNDTLTFGLTGPMASSYKLDTASTTGTLVVSPAALTVVANDQYMVSGSTVPALGYSLVGLVNADTAATAVTGAPSLSTAATSSSPAGSYAINLGLGTLASTNYSLTPANGVLNVFAPIAFGPVAVGSTGTADVSFETGPASKFASAHGATNALGVSVFRDSNTGCSAGTCTGTLSFRPTLPGSWSGALNLFDNSYPENLLVSIPVSGTGTAPQAVFTPGLATTVGSGLSFPTGIAVDSNLNVYIADLGNNRVIEYPTGGGVPILIGTGLNQPTGVAVDSQFNVYITDTGNHRVVEVPAGGNPQAVLAAGLNHAAGIAVDGGGNIYVADSFASAVYRIPFGGGALVPIGSGWISPFGITVDGAGNVFVADSNLNSVIKLPAGGGATVSLPFTGLNYPSGVAVDAVGNLFVSDTLNHRIVELSAVTGMQIPLITGLSYPYLLAIDHFGLLYIPDSSNNPLIYAESLRLPEPGFCSHGTRGNQC